MRHIYYICCGECHSNNIWEDDKKGELFCMDCGLVLEEKYAMISIPDIIDYLKIIEREERKEMLKKLNLEQ